MGPRKSKKHDKDDTITISEDSMSPVRKSSRKSVKPVKYGAGDDDDDSEIVTPEKIPVVVHTPRKSRRSKDMSPPPLRHRQNRMPEQVELIKGDSKYIFYYILICRQMSITVFLKNFVGIPNDKDF